MSSSPETRPSLLIRVRDPADKAAWQEFVEIYRPVILRLAEQKGMQAADAEDVAQEVLAAVAKAIAEREHDPQRAKFGTWLHRVAYNAIIDALTRRKPDRGSGNSGCTWHSTGTSAQRSGLGSAPPGISPGSVPVGRATGTQGIPAGNVGRPSLADRHRWTVHRGRGEGIKKSPRSDLHRTQPSYPAHFEEKVTEYEQDA